MNVLPYIGLFHENYYDCNKIDQFSKNDQLIIVFQFIDALLRLLWKKMQRDYVMTLNGDFN